MNAEARAVAFWVTVGIVAMTIVSFVIGWAKIGFVVLDYVVRHESGPTKQDVESALRESGISRGHSKDSVHAWLNDRGWTVCHQDGPAKKRDTRPLLTMDSEAFPGVQGDLYDIFSYTSVEIRGRETSVSQWYIYVYFFFDKDSHLINHYVCEVNHGL
jgi:hypothetical protein